jgi:predicted RNA-binding Zn ribbon-like protein
MATQATKPFELHGNPALDFVNTLDNRFNKPNDPDSARPPEELLKTYNDLLRFVTQSELLTEAKARELRRLASSAPKREQACNQVLYEARVFREHLALVTYALIDGLKIPEVSLAVLDASIKQATAHRELVREDNLLVWRWSGITSYLASPLWLLAQTTADLLLSENVSWIRSCSAVTCRWLFLDTSKNHARRWCDMKICGNRMKARRYHLRNSEQAK